MMLAISRPIRTSLKYHPRSRHQYRCFLSSKSPPSSSARGNNSNNNNAEKSETSKRSFTKQQQQKQSTTTTTTVTTTPVQRFKTPKRKVWNNRNIQQNKYQQISSVIQPTQYYCRPRRKDDPILDGGVSLSQSSDYNTSESATTTTAPILNSIDASALLDPRKYCRSSSKSTLTHNVSRSIDGTAAARRVLRGKKDFFVAARKLINNPSPVLLTGHTVPDQLLQHCIDMGDEILKFYGPDACECSFYNYHNDIDDQNNYYYQQQQQQQRGGSNNSQGRKPVSLPLHVKVRQRGGNNKCLQPPSVYNSQIYTNNDIDWDHHLELYLTVMENFTNQLGKIFEKDYSSSTTTTTKNNDKAGDDRNNISNKSASSKPPPIDEYHEDDDDDFTSSSLLYQTSPPPKWNVEILRGPHYDLGTILQPGEREDDSDSDIDDEDYGEVPPHPLIEFKRRPSTNPGQVLIRLQGTPKPNMYFGTSKQDHPQPVTLVFQASYF